MADDAGGTAGAGPPSFPGGEGSGTAAPPPMPPPMPPPPPLYPDPPAGGFPPPAYDAPSGVAYASWGIRVGGYLIDAVIFAVVNAILGAVLRHSNTLQVHMTMTTNGTVRHNNFSILAILITQVLILIYATILIGGPKGQTIGMMAVGIRAVRLDTMGVVGPGKAFGRALVELVFGYTVIVGLIDMLFPLWDPKRQTLHDKVVGTVVLRVRNAG